MDVFEAIKTRRSIRKFDPYKKISQEQIKKLLESARWAPSAGNLQSRYFVIVKNIRQKKLLVKASIYKQEFISQAQAVIIVCADPKKSASQYGSRGRKLYAVQDAAIAAQNIWLAATAMGLGTVWVGAFDEKKVSQLLKLPKNLRPTVIMPIGYPAEKPLPPERRPLKEIVKRI